MVASCPGCGKNYLLQTTAPSPCPQCGTMLRPSGPPVKEPPIAARTGRQAQAPAAPSPPPPPPPPGASAPIKPDAKPLPPLAPDRLVKVAEIEARIRANPSTRSSYLLLAKVYLEASRKDLAQATYERFLAMVPGDAVVREKLQALLQPATSEPPGPSGGIGPVRSRERDMDPRILRVAAALAAAVVLLAGVALVRYVLFPSTRPLVVGGASAHHPRWSPKGDKVAFLLSRDDGTALCVYDLDTKGAREVFHPKRGWIEPSFVWSADGRSLAFEALDPESYQQAVYVVDALGGEPRRAGVGNSPSFAPDGTSIAMRCAPDLEERRRRFQRDDVPAEREEVLSAEDEGKPCMVDVITGKVTGLADKASGPPMVSPRGDLVVFSIRERRPRLQAEAGSSSGLQRSFIDFATDAVSGDPKNVGGAQRALANQARRDQLREKNEASRSGLPVGEVDVYAVNLDGSGLHPLTSDKRSADPRFAAQGEKILFTYYAYDSTSSGREWVMHADGTFRQPLLPEGIEVDDLSDIALTPDGRRVVFRAPVKEVTNDAVAALMTRSAPLDLYVLEVGGARPRRLANQHTFKQGFALSPDGRRVVYERVNKSTSATELWLLRL